MFKIDTKILLFLLSVLDLLFGSGGAVTIVLWLAYGFYKSIN